MPTLSPVVINKLSKIKDLTTRQRYVQFYQLPQDLQEAMFSEKTSDTIWSIIKDKHGLAEQSVSSVARIIGLIFLGELPIQRFIIALKDDLKIDTPTATAIAQDINQTVFQPVRESLMEVHSIAPKVGPTIRQQYAEQKPQEGFSTPPAPPLQTQLPRQPSVNTEAEQKRRELLARLRPDENNQKPLSPYQPRPASWRNHRSRVIDLRNIKRRNGKYSGFFA